MWLSNAIKLHNGDEVAVRKSASGESVIVYATVLKAYSHPSQPKLVYFDVITHQGRYITGINHKDLV